MKRHTSAPRKHTRMLAWMSFSRSECRIAGCVRPERIYGRGLGGALNRLSQPIPGQLTSLLTAGGAQAFSTAFGQLSPADQARIGTVVYLSPGMVGTIAMPGGAQNTFVVLGQGIVDLGATVGTTIPIGVNITQTGCAHTDVNCLIDNAPLAQISSNGPCNSPATFVRNGPQISAVSLGGAVLGTSFGWYWSFTNAVSQMVEGFGTQQITSIIHWDMRF